MRYVAAAMLAVLGGGEPNAANIKKILSSVGIDADDAKVDMVAKELAGKNIEELLEQGKDKLGTMPAAGAAPAGGAAAGGAPAAAAAAPAKVEEEEEEEDDDMGFGLFD